MFNLSTRETETGGSKGAHTHTHSQTCTRAGVLTHREINREKKTERETHAERDRQTHTHREFFEIRLSLGSQHFQALL